MSDKEKPMSEMPEYVSACCQGEVCSMCGKPASRKVGEEIFHDDPNPYRHNFTAYVCFDHFTKIMDRGGYTRADIIQAKDAEIATLKAERDLLARALVVMANLFSGYEDLVGVELARKIVRGE